MPNLNYDIREGLQLDRNDGAITVRVHYMAENLPLAGTGAGGAVDVLSCALLLHGGAGNIAHTGANLPEDGDTLIVLGRTLYATKFEVKPWSNADADIYVTFNEPSASGGGGDFDVNGFSKVDLSGGTSVEKSESEFDATNRALSFNARVPIFVEFDPTTDGPPGGTNNREPQGGRLPYWKKNSTVNWTRTETTDPSGRSRAYSGTRNSGVWKGLAIGTVLCENVTFVRLPNGYYRVTYAFRYDPDDKWQQVARWKDPLTQHYPKLTVNQIAGANGIKEVTMQGSADFNALVLTV